MSCVMSGLIMVTDEVIVFELSEHTVVTVHKKTPPFGGGSRLETEASWFRFHERRGLKHFLFVRVHPPDASASEAIVFVGTEMICSSLM